jgi:hypothetical protein
LGNKLGVHGLVRPPSGGLDERDDLGEALVPAFCDRPPGTSRNERRHLGGDGIDRPKSRYLRASTEEQAEKALSLTARRRSAEDFAARHGAVIDHQHVEPGASGTDTRRTVFNELLGDALQPGSTVSTIIVHHGSCFTRDATRTRAS